MSIAAFGIVNKLNEPLYLFADSSSSSSPREDSREDAETDEAEVVNRHAIMFTALDSIEARRTKGSKSAGPTGQSGENFLGLLFSVGKTILYSSQGSLFTTCIATHPICTDDYRVYGAVSNTLTKMVLVMETNPTLGTEAVREIFTSESSISTQPTTHSTYRTARSCTPLVMQRLYASMMMNPFQDINSPITSTEFDRKVRSVVTKHNARISASQTL